MPGGAGGAQEGLTAQQDASLLRLKLLLLQAGHQRLKGSPHVALDSFRTRLFARTAAARGSGVSDRRAAPGPDQGPPLF
jgi:hypothetical protein